MSLIRLLIEISALILSCLVKISLFLYHTFLAGFVSSLPIKRKAADRLYKDLSNPSLYSLSAIISDSDSSHSEEEKDQVSDIGGDSHLLHQKIINAVDIVDICHAHGYKVHEHVVQTTDGYLLAIHRIIPKTISNAKSRSYSSDLKNLNLPVVYFHHGLLTNSELFVLGDETSKCLPFMLLEKGYDVWLGNNRGNKYSRKHIDLSASSSEFWDYSLDEYAMYDIPNTIDYVLEATNQKTLSYIGFSQGSAQCLAALSLSPKLNDKINVFIGLSPAMIPRGLSHPLASFFVNSAQSFLFNLFGTRAILPSVVFWQQLMGPYYYKLVVDRSLVLLFGWNSSNISEVQKKVGYQHMFSPSSVKSVVHWLQIIKYKRFQMYDEGGNAGSKLNALSLKHKAHRVAPFPTQTISTPMLLVYGTSDSLIDIEKTLQNLSCPVETIGIESYEHMDTLWAYDVVDTVFNPVLEKLDEFNADRKLLDERGGKGENTIINNGKMNLSLNAPTVLVNGSLKEEFTKDKENRIGIEF